MTVAFFLWYALYVLLSAYARGFMGTKVIGNINVALVFGLLQFVIDVPDRLALLPVRRPASSTRSPTRSSAELEAKVTRVMRLTSSPLRRRPRPPAP